jgi:hypothetical protein
VGQVSDCADFCLNLDSCRGPCCGGEPKQPNQTVIRCVGG